MVFQPQAAGNDSLQFWLPRDFNREFMALGAFDEYVWIDYARGFVVAQFSTGGVVSSSEFEAAIRALGDAVTTGSAAD